jgi:hypothetical protein
MSESPWLGLTEPRLFLLDGLDYGTNANRCFCSLVSAIPLLVILIMCPVVYYSLFHSCGSRPHAVSRTSQAGGHPR